MRICPNVQCRCDIGVIVCMHTLTLTKLISGYNSGRNRSLRNYERKQSNEQVTDKSDKQDILLTGGSVL